MKPRAEDSGDPPDRPIGHGATVGGILRETREELGMSLRDAAAQLKIRAPYLDCLERNDLSGLPGSAYAAGFLRSYADLLGLDGKRLVERLRREQSELSEPIPLDFPVPLTRSGIPGGGILLIALVIVTLGWGTWYYIASGAHSRPPAVEPVPTHLLPPPPVDEVPPTATDSTPPEPVASADTPLAPAGPAPTPTPTPAPSAIQTATLQPQPPAAPQPQPAQAPVSKTTAKSYGEAAPARLVIRATAPCWLEIRVPGKPVWGGLLGPGETYNVANGSTGKIRAGNAGALVFQVDGTPHGPFGALGEVKEFDIDPDALATRG